MNTNLKALEKFVEYGINEMADTIEWATNHMPEKPVYYRRQYAINKIDEIDESISGAIRFATIWAELVKQSDVEKLEKKAVKAWTKYIEMASYIN